MDPHTNYTCLSRNLMKEHIFTSLINTAMKRASSVVGILLVHDVSGGRKGVEEGKKKKEMKRKKKGN